MSSLLTVNPSRLIRLTLALILAFFSVGALTLAGSMLLPSAANAAAPPAICSTAGQISIELSDGSSRCVDNTCEGVMGAEGRAAECTATKPASNISVPDANSGLSGVAPVATPAPARASASTSTKTASGTSAGVTLAWIFAGIGILALLIGFGLVGRGRVRSARWTRAARKAEGSTPAAL